MQNLRAPASSSNSSSPMMMRVRPSEQQQQQQQQQQQCGFNTHHFRPPTRYAPPRTYVCPQGPPPTQPPPAPIRPALIRPGPLRFGPPPPPPPPPPQSGPIRPIPIGSGPPRFVFCKYCRECFYSPRALALHENNAHRSSPSGGPLSRPQPPASSGPGSLASPMDRAMYAFSGVRGNQPNAGGPFGPSLLEMYGQILRGTAISPGPAPGSSSLTCPRGLQSAAALFGFAVSTPVEGLMLAQQQLEALRSSSPRVSTPPKRNFEALEQTTEASASNTGGSAAAGSLVEGGGPKRRRTRPPQEQQEGPDTALKL